MRNILILILIVVASALGGCAKCVDCGDLRLSGKAISMVRNGVIVEEYNYYIYRRGSGQPKAVLGLDKKYTLQGDAWKPIDLTSETLSRWAKRNDLDSYKYDDFDQIYLHYQGSNVLNPAGELVGLYYATYDQVRMTFSENGIVTVSKPRPSSLQITYRWGRDD